MMGTLVRDRARACSDLSVAFDGFGRNIAG